MGTRSTIAVKDGNNVTWVYCHWDGYLDHNGKLLFENYNSKEKALEIVSHGNMSSLGKTIGEKVDFNKVPPDHEGCIFYCRDRGENLKIQKCSLVYEIEKEQYNYVFDCGENRWLFFVGENHHNLQDLESALK